MALLHLHSRALHRSPLLPPLAVLLLAAIAALPATFLQAADNCTQMATLTQGPFWIEENIEASNLRLNVSYGVPLKLTFRLTNQTLSTLLGYCVPIPAARIDLWHARYDGLYSDVEKEKTAGTKWLRGFQYTNATGYAKFHTIFPGWYKTRTIHIHMRIRIYDDGNTTTTYDKTTQIYFDEAISQAICENVYPYNARGSTRDTFNDNDSLFRSANVITIEGHYNDIHGYSGIVELSLPFSGFRSMLTNGQGIKSDDHNNNKI